MTWIFYAILSAFFAALVAIFGKIGIKGIDSTAATTVRAVVMAAFLIVVSLALGKLESFSKIDRRAFLFIVLAGVAGALSWLAYFFALQKGPAHGVAALDRTSVAIVAVAAAIFLGEAFTWKVALGAVMIVAGAILMI
jgi:bacterial/archaeal transporter family protein